MTAYDGASFSAGQDCGTRTAACVARLAALTLLDEARWWNRARHRAMADALVACAEELECDADADARDRAGALETRPEIVRPILRGHASLARIGVGSDERAALGAQDPEAARALELPAGRSG